MTGFQLQNSSRRGGGGVRRVLSVASIANQPHVFDNKYVAGSGVGATTISNRRAKMRRTYYQPPAQIILGEEITKDMSNDVYTDRINPFNFQSELFSGMVDFIDENIIAGDKTEENRLTASYWLDWGNDIFDGFGFFYIYDVNSEKYYFPLFTPINLDDGIITTQIFNVFERTFTIKHGYPARGIWKFDITVADNLPFIFGAYGNIGSDNRTMYNNLTYSYRYQNNNLILYTHENYQTDKLSEKLYSYWIPKVISENASQTYNINYTNNDKISIRTNTIHTGVIIYMSKRYNVKEWVINDLHN
jgi:hypothetical protein